MFLKRDLWGGFWHCFVDLEHSFFRGSCWKSLLRALPARAVSGRDRSNERRESLIYVPFQHFASSSVVYARDGTVVIFVSSSFALFLFDWQKMLNILLHHTSYCVLLSHGGNFFALAIVNRTPFRIRYIARFGQDKSRQFLLLTLPDPRLKTQPLFVTVPSAA